MNLDTSDWILAIALILFVIAISIIAALAIADAVKRFRIIEVEERRRDKSAILQPQKAAQKQAQLN